MSRGPKQVFLHVGLPKTGTTFLQAVLAASRDSLAEGGVLYPGKGSAHFLAAQDLTQHLFMGREDPRIAGTWRKVVRQVKRGPQTAIISHELFTVAEPSQIAKAVKDLSPAEVHVVMTVRDFARQVPAVWQERLKNGGSVTFNRHFNQTVEQAEQRQQESVGFWKQQDAIAILTRWLEVIPKEQVHVITVPQRGAPKDLLWRRFAEVVGFPPGIADLDSVQARGNISLRPPTAKILRIVNKRLADSLPTTTYRAVVKRYLTEAAVQMPADTTHYSMSVAQLRQASRWSDELATFIRSRQLEAIGDLGDLKVVASAGADAPTLNLDDVPDAEAAAAGVATTAAILQWICKGVDTTQGRN